MNEDVTIRLAPIHDPSPVADEVDSQVQNPGEVLLEKHHVARYLLRHGREILIEPAPSADAGDIRAFLFGSVFAALCYARGMLPLHASVIDVSGGCIAFVGPKRAGKSTLVAALAARGHQVIADDVCCLRTLDSGEFLTWPGISRVRLFEDAITALGCHGPGLEREKRGKKKYFVPMQTLQNPAEPRRLRGVYQLHAASDSDSMAVTRLQGSEAIDVLLKNVFRVRLAKQMKKRSSVFSVCAAAANNVPVFRLSRRMDFDVLVDTVERLEDHLQTAS